MKKSTILFGAICSVILAFSQNAKADFMSTLTFTVTNSHGAAQWASDADVLAFNTNCSDATAHVYSTSSGKTGFAAEGEGTHPVPDGGATAVLLGLGLAGLAGIRARFGRN